MESPLSINLVGNIFLNRQLTTRIANMKSLEMITIFADPKPFSCQNFDFIKFSKFADFFLLLI
jgi:hypothetical protein